MLREKGLTIGFVNKRCKNDINIMFGLISHLCVGLLGRRR